MPQLATPTELDETVYVADCRWRNPFEVAHLPVAARLYRYRKGVVHGAGWLRKLARMALPSRLFMKCLFAWAGKRTCGEFLYRRGRDEKQVAFRMSNSQFRALYFPEYAGGYEPETTCLIDKILTAEPKATFFDIGANWGFYSLHAASLAGFRGRIEAFEPQPETFGDLASVVEQAGLSDLVTCHSAALSDKNAAGFIQMPDGLNSGLAALTSSSAGAPTKLVTLDSLACEPPGLLKVDVEGAEAAVFHGGRRILSQYQPMIVFESWHNAANAEESLLPLRVLQEIGYRFFQPTILPKSVAENPAPMESTTLRKYSDRLSGDTNEQLTLSEFAPEQRPLLAEHFNVFACHQARCDRWLRENFTALVGPACRAGLDMQHPTAHAPARRAA